MDTDMMSTNIDEEHSETNKGFQKASLRKTIYSRLRNKFTKKFIINHLIPILFFLFLSIFIFRDIIGVEGVIIQGDFIYSPDLEKFSQYFYSMWDENLGLSALSRLPRLLFYLPFIEIGFLFNMSTTDIMVITFIFCEFLAGISMYYASRYILSKTYKKFVHKIIQVIECPNCKNKVTLSGSLGDKVYITCPKCDEKGIFNFPEEQDFKTIGKIIQVIVGKFAVGTGSIEVRLQGVAHDRVSSQHAGTVAGSGTVAQGLPADILDAVHCRDNLGQG